MNVIIYPYLVDLLVKGAPAYKNILTFNQWCGVITWLVFPKCSQHDDVIKWKHFPRNWPFVRGIHWSPVNSPHKGQWRGALMFSLICARINDWVNNREAGDLRCHRGHYDVIVMNTCSIHLTSDVWGWDMWCHLYVQSTSYIPMLPLLHWMEYGLVMDHISMDM